MIPTPFRQAMGEGEAKRAILERQGSMSPVTTTPTPKRRGRPSLGAAAKSDAERQRALKERLEREGGKRVSVNLSAQAVADLERLADGQHTERTVIEWALRACARRRLKVPTTP